MSFYTVCSSHVLILRQSENINTLLPVKFMIHFIVAHICIIIVHENQVLIITISIKLITMLSLKKRYADVLL